MSRDLFSYFKKKKTEQAPPPVLVDLTPRDDVQGPEIYFSALDEAIHNKNVTNIAITGPYGSGKSSVIKSYLSSYRGIFYSLKKLRLKGQGGVLYYLRRRRFRNLRFVTISLADFDRELRLRKDLPCPDGKISEPEGNKPNSKIRKYNEASDNSLERSILQQLFYSVSSKELPQSKISRIRRVENGHFKVPLLILLIASSVVCYFSYMESGLTTVFGISLVISSSILYLIAVDIYRFLKGGAIKRVAFRGVNLDLDESSYDSLLNKYLDEIIYFFRETKKNVVFIEDLDRYNNSDIFVRLREINLLLNSGASGGEQVDFVYAIKDTFFKNESRAKFFDVIIPLIPVVSPTNSREAIQKRVDDEGWTEKIERELIKKISLYVFDYRLIHNIFNEYKVYIESLSDINLNPSKLLAVVVYKNLFPSDFHKLHEGGGVIVEVFNNFHKKKEKRKCEIEQEIQSLRGLLKAADNDFLRDVSELKRLYLSCIYEMLISNINTVRRPLKIVIEGKNIQLSFDNLSNDTFEKLFDESKVIFIVGPGNPGNRVSIGNMEDVEAKLSPEVDYFTRKDRLTKKSISNRESIKKSISRLNNDISFLDNARFSEIVDRYPELLEFPEGSGGIIRVLLRSGYIDENYTRYISRFYEGSLTRRDLEYINRVREGGGKNFELPIDNPKEVIVVA